MSTNEILVILFGLFIGYWVVSQLFTGDSAEKPRAASAPEPPPQSQAPAADSEKPQAWFEILNVPPDATVEEIRYAYRTLIRQYHPDKVANLGDELKALAERKSKDINAAYDHAMQMHGAAP